MTTPALSRTSLVAVVLSLALAAACRAAPAPDAQTDLVEAKLMADVDAATPGKSFTLGVRLTMKPGWHTYWVNPGESGQPTVVKLTGPKGFEFGTVRWPIPTRFEHEGTVTYGYEGEVLLLVPVTVAKDAATSGPAELDADLTWLSCKADTCVEGAAKPTLRLPVRDAAGGPANGELFDHWRKQLPAAIDASEPARSPAVAAASTAVAVKRVEQGSGPGGAPLPTFTVEWAGPAPKKVEWFPVSTGAVAIEDVVVESTGVGADGDKAGGGRTVVRFKPTVYKAAEVPGNKVGGVLVYEDAGGRRHGVAAPVRVSADKPAK